MREIDKTYSIKKNRQMKTTTILMTLLIAIALISSSAVTANTTNMNVENTIEDDGGQTAPASVGDTDTGAPDSPELCTILEKENPYQGSNRGVVVYDNGMSFNSLAASHVCSAYDAKSADDFVFAADQDVTDVHWIGGYWNGVTAPFDWNIEFFEDDGTGNAPGAQFALFTILNADITMVDLGSQYFEMSVDLPAAVSFDGGQKYWISIWSPSEFPPQAGFGSHPGIIGAEGMFLSVYFGYPTWTTGTIVTGTARDHAFQLTSAPEHDCYVDEIIAPNDVSAFCPCTPVEVTVKNGGILDQVDVPVSVEMRRYIFADSFEDPFGMFWDPIYAGNMWLQVTGETAYPFVVTPRTGIFMAELDSGMTGPGQAFLDSLPIDLTGLCHPMMSFYMWHDEYGSDDFIDVEVNGVNVGGPYTRLCCPDCPVGWQEHVIDLSAFAGTSVVIRFEGNCDSNPGAYDLQIDDMSIYDQEYYEEEEVDVNAGETVTVEFPEWCPCNWQNPAWANTFFDVEVIACTGLEIDQVPINDCVSEIVTMYMPFEHDIASISIDEPVGRVPVQAFEMCGTIKNVGQYQDCCFSVYMTVEEVVYGSLVTLYQEDFSSVIPPALPTGWVEETPTGNWRTYNFGYAGVAPELRFYWIPYVYGTYRCITPPINTVGMTEALVEFDHYLSHYSGPYTLRVETSTTGLPGSFTPIPELTWVNPSSFGATHEAETVTQDVGSATFYLSFTFADGDPFNLNYWDIDNILVQGQTVSFLPAEWEDEFCVDEIDVCEEMQICFDDWTPAQPWPDCGEKTYRIGLEPRLCDPMDDNPANNFVYEFITVEFWHDVGIKQVTSPGSGARVPGDVLWNWDGEAPTGDNQLLGVEVVGNNIWVTGGNSGSDPNKLYKLDLIGNLLNTYDQSSSAGWGWRDLAYDGQYLYASDSATVVEIDPATGMATGNTIPGPINPCRALAYNPNSDTFYTASFTTNFYEFDRTGAIINSWTNPWGGAYGMAFDDICEGYLWVHDQYGSGTDMHQIDVTTGTHTGLTYAYTQGIAGGLAIADIGGYAQLVGLTQGTPDEVFGVELCESGPQPPQIDIIIPCGEQDLCAIFENLGTFDEIGCTIYWDLYEYQSDFPNPTWLDGDSEIVDLDAMTEEEICFGTFNFADPGFYALIIEIVPPGVDCYPDNNMADIGIGVDCCPPESEHSLDPATPDGENNWYVSDVEVTITAEDPMCPDPCEMGIISGVAEIKYTINGVPGSITGDSGSFVLDEDGNNLVTYWAIDGVGNEEVAHTFTVAIDQTPPTVDLAHTEYEGTTGWMVDFEAITGEETSGMNRVEFKRGSELLDTVTAPPYEYTHTWESGDGSATFYAYAYDQAGNSASDSASIQLSLNLVLSQGKVVNVNQVLQRLI